MAASMAAVLLASGEKGKRFVLPNSEIFDSELETQKNDKWVVWAIALAVIALLAILLKN